jgi:hypothetical protein
MDNAEYCRSQAQECRRLLGLPQSEAAAQVLRNLSQSWTRLANQADLYRDIVRQSGAPSVGGQAPPRGRTLADHRRALALPQRDKDGRL